ncbi:MAG: helicase HerA-like domain-containing protein [Chitinophagales bacterium]
MGEALVTTLNEKGIPTPLAHTLIRPPMSRIGVLTSDELDEIVSNSEILDNYKDVIDRESAYEILTGKIRDAQIEGESEEMTKEESPSVFERVGDAINSPVGKIIVREVTRGLLGVLGFGRRRR